MDQEKLNQQSWHWEDSFSCKPEMFGLEPSIVAKKSIKLFEENLGTNGQIAKSFEKYPYTKTYDCSSNFAPITLFNYEEMKEFK